jgi:cell shape-determining protein MreD
MRNLVAIPLLFLVVFVQSAIVPVFSLLAGYADLLLVLLAAWALQEGVDTAYQWALLGGLMISMISRLPWFIYLGGYLAVVLFARLLQERVWQVPLLAMFTVTFLGTVFMHLLTFIYLGLFGRDLSISDAMGLVTLPSVLLNLLVAIPMFGIMRDLARWVFPTQEAA